jgi:hypothetical protein
MILNRHVVWHAVEHVWLSGDVEHLVLIMRVPKESIGGQDKGVPCTGL